MGPIILNVHPNSNIAFLIGITRAKKLTKQYGALSVNDMVTDEERTAVEAEERRQREEEEAGNPSDEEEEETDPAWGVSSDELHLNFMNWK